MQTTAYEWRFSDWSSCVCYSDLGPSPRRSCSPLQSPLAASAAVHDGFAAGDRLFRPGQLLQRPDMIPLAVMDDAIKPSCRGGAVVEPVQREGAFRRVAEQPRIDRKRTRLNSRH